MLRRIYIYLCNQIYVARSNAAHRSYRHECQVRLDDIYRNS
jgi:hypothetical protein